MSNFPVVFHGSFQFSSYLLTSDLTLSAQRQNDVRKFRTNWKNVIQKQPFGDVFLNRCSKNFANFTGEHLCWSLFLKGLQVEALQHYQKESPTQVFSCEVGKTFKNTCFLQNTSGGCFWWYKSHTRLFILRKQTFSFYSTPHFSKTVYYLLFYRHKNNETPITKLFRLP